MKKIRILVLAVIMAVAVMPGSVFAGDISDSTDDGIRAVSAATDDHTCQGRIQSRWRLQDKSRDQRQIKDRSVFRQKKGEDIDILQ